MLSVLDKDEHEIASLDGWSDSIPEALAGKPVVDEDDNRPPTRDELMAKAKELGIQVDGRWSDKKILQAIEDKLSEE